MFGWSVMPYLKQFEQTAEWWTWSVAMDNLRSAVQRIRDAVNTSQGPGNPCGGAKREQPTISA